MKYVKIFGKSLIIAAISLFIISCGKKDTPAPQEDELPNGEETPLDHSFTIKEGETGWKFEANGTLYEGTARIVGSMETDKSFPVDFWLGPQSIGGFGFLPQKTGTFKSGYDFGKGNGTYGNNYYLTSSLKVGGETYYAYSSHVYGFLEQDKIEGAECTVQIVKYTLKHTTYKFMGSTYSGLIGNADGLFKGTFKTKDGSKSITIIKGEFRTESKLPTGAEVVGQ